MKRLIVVYLCACSRGLESRWLANALWGPTLGYFYALLNERWHTEVWRRDLWPDDPSQHA